ncbi:Formate-dependent phosphoribosylglycinamide formyltransferase (GAR transformylase) [Achromobacter ruhlandii]|nr:hypothetical protein [Achromobacter ruhlandii]CUJ17889.1 Formate-dependent phosphoribosylglycinamide formyltransferase (GAR transformylase) [Achromobacter ruhlandii]CUJ93223.1 Formate-dependent phosphoribosylglycinamide formyltransferase (GAR transformylase) [Achromobacter ruhlandii]
MNKTKGCLIANFATVPFVKRRMGVGLAVAEDVAAARAKAKRVSAAVTVKAG